MTFVIDNRPIDILLIEDNPGDIRLTREALKDAKVTNVLTVVSDGIEALALLHRNGKHATSARPDLIILDLNLPKKDGWELLAEIKSDDELRIIPVIVLTTSTADADIIKSYDLHANCYITKPVDLEQFIEVVKSVNDFWLSVVRLPGGKQYE